MSPELVSHAALCLLLFAPLTSFLALGTLMLVGVRLTEKSVVRWTRVAAAGGLLGAAVLCVPSTAVHQVFSLLELPGHTIELVLVADDLSRLWLLIIALLCAVGIRFSEPYLHREKRFASFHLLFCLFELGMLLSAAGGNLTTVFVGWELVGISSTLLIAFFVERKNAVRASLRAFATYRMGDVGLLIGTALLHQHAGGLDFSELQHAPIYASGFWCGAIGFCLLVAAIGKSAQLPVSGWLPGAMEGPTPSSALFYGGLAVHLGVLLLIRVQPLLAHGHAAWAVGVVGGLTALHATAAARVQTDVKSALAYATLAQVGLMFVECALGWTTLSSVHFCLHAALRTYQLLRAPSALAEAREIQAAHQARLPALPRIWSRPAPRALQNKFYAWSLERFGADLLVEWMMSPLFSLSVALGKGEEWALRKLNGERTKKLRAFSSPAPESTREAS